MTPPDPGQAVWEHIRRGRAPTSERVAEVAALAAPVLGSLGTEGLRESLHEAVLGLGPLEEVVADPAVTDVLVNGDGRIWTDRGDGVRPTGGHAGDPAALRRLAVRLAGLAGQRLDTASPCVDGLLPGGIRLHAVLPPLVDTGPHLSLRIPRRVTPGLDDLVALGTMPAPVAAVLRGVVRDRRSFLISGGTGSGKTTLLGALLGAADPEERIVLVEDVRELSVRHPHVVRLQARAANVEGRGAVPLTVLVRQCLRMRPDRVVVGEVRGAEVRELLTALNTGHRGGCGTVHANSALDIVARFEALGALADLGPPAVRVQLGTAVDVVVHLGRLPDGARALQQIAVLRRVGGDGVDVVPAWTRTSAGEYRTGPGAPELTAGPSC